MTKYVLPTLTWTATLLLSAMFLFVSSVKILDWNPDAVAGMMQSMELFGLNRAALTATGVIEAFGAICILAQGRHWIGTVGAGAILTTSAGATILYAIFFDPLLTLHLTHITFALSAFVFWRGRRLLINRFMPQQATGQS